MAKVMNESKKTSDPFFSKSEENLNKLSIGRDCQSELEMILVNDGVNPRPHQSDFFHTGGSTVRSKIIIGARRWLNTKPPMTSRSLRKCEGLFLETREMPVGFEFRMLVAP